MLKFDLPSSACRHLLPSTGEGVLTELWPIVYESIFSNAPKSLYFTGDFLMAGIAGVLPAIQLNNQLMTQTHKIDNIGDYRKLSSKF